MRQKQKEMSQAFEESRPLSSEASEIAYDENGSTATVTRRDKSRVQIQVFENYAYAYLSLAIKSLFKIIHSQQKIVYTFQIDLK